MKIALQLIERKGRVIDLIKIKGKNELNQLCSYKSRTTTTTLYRFALFIPAYFIHSIAKLSYYYYSV